MTSVTIFGAGTMGQNIGKVLSAGGASVSYRGREDVATPIDAEVVVLAVPYAAIADIVDRHGSELAGKIVVDITNPIDFATFDRLVVPADSSAAAVVSDALPEARVIKAFNTNFGATLAAGAVGEQATTVLIAGDDAGAKATLGELVTAGGLRAVDAGELKRARELESLALLQITLAAKGSIGWTGGFSLVN